MAGNTIKALTLREIDAIEDPEERRRAMLDRFEEDRRIALERTKTIGLGKGESAECADPDINAAIKADAEAMTLLNIEPRKKGSPGPGLSVFEGGKGNAA